MESDDDFSTIPMSFDPTLIRIRTQVISIDNIVNRIDHNEIDLAPDFQRELGIWRPMQKSRFIESLLLRIPIPVFYVAEDDADNWLVIDGIQRLSTIHDFFRNKFRLEGLEYLDAAELCFFENLPRRLTRRIRETELFINVVERQTPEQVRFNIFRRINTGGNLLNYQEIRHALFQGPVRSYLKELSQSEEFKKATRNKIPPTRMKDRESILRFTAFRIKRWNRYSSDNSDDFQEYLNNTMRTINSMNNVRRRDLSREFVKAMKAATKIFEDAETCMCQVPKLWQESIYTGMTSRSLFEVWSVCLSRCTGPQIETLVGNKDDVVNEFALRIEEDSGFLDSISKFIGHPDHVRKRFETIENLIKEYRADD